MKKLYVLAISVFAAGLATAQVSLSTVTANQGNPVLTSQSKVLIDKPIMVDSVLLLKLKKPLRLVV